MTLYPKLILDALTKVRYPGTGKNLVEAGMVEDDIRIEGNKVSFSLLFEKPNDPFIKSVVKAAETAILTYVSPDVDIKGNISIVSQQAARPEPDKLLPQVKNIIAVSSGKGGVGKSTVAANLAVALAGLGYKVGLLDADIFGPSQPKMFNVEEARPYMVKVEGRELMLDLPPGTSDIHLTLVQTLAITGAIVVTTPQDVALADARKGISMFQGEKVNVPVLGLVENMSWFTPAELPENKYYLFGKDGGKKLAEELDVPLLGQIPIVQSIREGGDNGEPVALNPESITGHAFRDLAENMIQQVEYRNTHLAPTERVQTKK
jgi:ATP-binding protein involved in chromosome partitioning